MTIADQQKRLLARVAEALPVDLLENVAFVGGMAVPLWVTDELTAHDARSTDDVDLIVNVMGRQGWYQLQEQLRACGFSEPGLQEDEAPVCRMRLGELEVDFMPDDAAVLGFSNRWYSQALETAQQIALRPGLVIRVVSPVLCIATKLEAYRGRGEGDALGSRDIEDILTLLDGRQELAVEFERAPKEQLAFIAEEFSQLSDDDGFAAGVASTAGSADREQLLWSRIDHVIELADQGEPT